MTNLLSKVEVGCFRTKILNCTEDVYCTCVDLIILVLLMKIFCNEGDLHSGGETNFRRIGR